MPDEKLKLPEYWILTAEDIRLTSEVLNDPLGLTSIWSYFGHKLIPHLTTVSSNIRLFHSSLLALTCINEWENGQISSNNPLFWLWLCAIEELVVHVQMRRNPDDRAGLRGVRQALRLINESKVKIGIGREAELLSDRSRNGMYSAVKAPLQSMGIIDSQGRMEHEVTVEIQALFNALDDQAFRKAQKDFSRLIQDGFHQQGNPQTIVVELAYKRYHEFLDPLVLFPSSSSKEFRLFWEKKLTIKPFEAKTNHRGAEAVLKCIREERVRSPGEIIDALKKHPDSSIKEMADQILKLELLLCLIQPCFEMVARSTTLQAATRRISSRYLQKVKKAAEQLTIAIQVKEERDKGNWLFAFKDCSEVDELVRMLIEQHEESMESRDRQPWITLEGNKIKSELPKDDDFNLEESVRFSRRDYFISSMVNILTANYQAGVEEL